MRSVKDLESSALNFWPREIAEKEKSSSIIPYLIDSLDKFISILKVSDKTPFVWQETLKNTEGMPYNLFLKHLMVLADIGGEPLKRFKTNMKRIFSDSEMVFSWRGDQYMYEFQTLDERVAWNNKNLMVDGEGLLSNEIGLFGDENIPPLFCDVIMLIMFGGASNSENLPSKIEERCIIGTLLGNSEEIDDFVSERYIWVSRITGGATANNLGYLAEDYVRDYLSDSLPDWDFDNSIIPGISQNDGRTPIKFDMVAKSPEDNYCAIEVSFQVTTNSTIERKAGQAQSRKRNLEQEGHKIAYVVDGAGNFERSSAIQTISNFSDLIVTFDDDELQKLAEFLKTIDKN